MSEQTNPYLSVTQTPEPKTPSAPSKPLSIGGWIAWFAIIALTLVMFGLVLITQLVGEQQANGDAGPVDLLEMQINAKTVVFQNNIQELVPDAKGPQPDVPDELNRGCYEARLCFCILKNEANGADAALQELAALDTLAEDHNLELTDNQQRSRDLLAELFEQYSLGDMDATTLADEDREHLESKLGFCGTLVLHPAGTPAKPQRDSIVRTTVYKIFGLASMGLFGVLLFLFGIVMVIVFSIYLFNRKLESRVDSTPADHNIYAETFAIWMAGFFGASIVIGMITDNMATQMLAQPIVFFGSLVSLAWPVARGVPFGQVLQDIGWTIRQPMTNLLVTPLTYAATLPLLIPGMIFFLICALVTAQFQDTSEFAGGSGPGHPIQEYIAEGNFTIIALVVLTACVAAPVVEETMFRGVLYRHLRDWSRGRTLLASVIFSSVINGFIFASIHPQGIVAIPLLMTLGIGFSLAREWRGSLITPMAMHAVHNSLITCVSLIIL